MFGSQQKKYALFFRVDGNTLDIPIELRRYKANVENSPEGTRKEIRVLVHEFIPIFVDNIMLKDVSNDILPIVGER